MLIYVVIATSPSKTTVLALYFFILCIIPTRPESGKDFGDSLMIKILSTLNPPSVKTSPDLSHTIFIYLF